LSGLLPSKPPTDADDGTWADGYHGKVMPLDAVTQLVTIQHDIDLGDLEQIIPYSSARDIVVQHPDHIVALVCPCRAARSDPCEPLDVCLIVGEPFASFVFEHHSRRSRWITSEEAVAILQAEDERGHVHHAFFKDAMLGRFYAICNCCACCCGAIQAHRGGTPMLASSGYVNQVDPDWCAGCGQCVDFCQFGALAIDNRVAVVDTTACMGCGVCVSHCAQGALSLIRDPAKGVPLEIRELLAQKVETCPAIP
jgi:ferredoxin